MFQSFREFISSLANDDGSRNPSESSDYHLATAALLIRVATIDGEMSQARRARLHAVLTTDFGLDDPTTARLIDEASDAARSAVDLYHFTRRLNGVPDGDGGRRIVERMWEIAYADGGASELEDNIIWRAADLLGVSSRQRIELRRRVAADTAAAVPASRRNADRA